jgi:predicted neutral ceramidase superfamily lipid hydrolase
MVGVVFIAIMFEVTTLLIILSVRSHASSLSSLLILVEGFSFSPDWLVVSTHSYHHTQSFVVMGFVGFETLVSLCIISLGYGFVHVTDVCTVGYDSHYAKGHA